MVRFAADPFSARGIRADPDAPDPESPESGAIIVEWNSISPSRLKDVLLGGYNLYRSSTVEAGGKAVRFQKIRSLPYTSPTVFDTSLTDFDVRQGIQYFYYVTAYSRTDERQESVPSDTVAFTLLTRPIPMEPISILDTSRRGPIELRFGPSTAGGQVAVQLNQVRHDNENVVIRSVWRYTGNVGYTDPHVDLPRDTIQKGARYRWRVDKILPGQPLGNSSRWVTFVAP